ncbi:Hypothetical predicted protein [Podarcis lilfordi]|uniref:Uncharacterized protein n=1 Tax=Podarcis lilfordi TaxID=74358 RepID=A0AA35KWS2_9SAUR|nr:Hypothetical predicted protein [Podarcis lilfordi]
MGFPFRVPQSKTERIQGSLWVPAGKRRPLMSISRSLEMRKAGSEDLLQREASRGRFLFPRGGWR